MIHNVVIISITFCVIIIIVIIVVIIITTITRVIISICISISISIVSQTGTVSCYVSLFSRTRRTAEKTIAAVAQSRLCSTRNGVAS